MIYEISGVCQHCSESVKVVVEHNTRKLESPLCYQEPFKFKKFKGVIYVLSNPHQQGVKVGKTTKDAQTRAKALSTTGVPGRFAVLAVFPSQRPDTDEKKAHAKLRKWRIAGEHFDLDPAEAIVRIRSALNRREPIIYDDDLKVEVDSAVKQNRRATEHLRSRRPQSSPGRTRSIKYTAGL